MHKEPLEYVKHIRDECTFILSVIDGNVTKEVFLQMKPWKELWWEASKKIPADFKVRWSSITRKNIAGMRDRLIHDYMGVNYLIVWDVVKNKIPELDKQIEEVLSKE